VVVGVTAEGLHEAFTTPFRIGEINGPEVHANVIDALLVNRSIERSPAWVSVALIVAGAAGVGLAGLVLNAWLTGVVAMTLALLLAGAAVWLFARGVWIPITVPALAIIFAFVGDLAWKYFVEGRDKRLIKKMFSRYVSKDVFDQLLANPSLAALGGARRHMTVLFSDIRGFTTMSEKGTPEDVVAQLNQLFTRMVGVVFAHRGTVDKFVGDMVMALYGAPLDDADHADHAVQTALEMIRTLQEMNREWQAQGKPTLDIGIGINTGDMVAGNIGSDTIMSYTVIGDAVNLGARLESLNKDYGTRIIISEFTRAALKGRYDIHPLGEVVVKGKTRPVTIFEVKPT
jgi:adenylate cyclase